MSLQMDDYYYTGIRDTAEELTGMGLDSLLTKDVIVSRNKYTGVEELQEWRDAGRPSRQDPEQFGLKGRDIVGKWIANCSKYYGHYPVVIRDNGECVIATKCSRRSLDDIVKEIDVAREYRLPIGISAAIPVVKHLVDPGCRTPNAIVYADDYALRHFGSDGQILRIESLDHKAWIYAFIDFTSSDIAQYMPQGIDKYPYKVDGSTHQSGQIVRRGYAPCFPSIVLGNPVLLLQGGSGSKSIVIPSASRAGISLDIEDDDEWDDDDTDEGDMNEDGEYVEDDYNGFLTDNDAWRREDRWRDLDETLIYEEGPEWIRSIPPIDDDEVFEQAVRQYEATPNNRGLTSKPRDTLFTDDWGSEPLVDSGIDIGKMLPPPLAASLKLLMQDLPYDETSVLVSFLTSAASMLRLGTTVTGNEFTDYKVPVNLYTILSAKSGRKKTPLQNKFVDEPASDVMLKVAQENTQLMRKWEDDNRGKKDGDKQPQPVPLDLRINDYTGEAFVKALARLDEVGRAVLIEREEISALFASLNSYRSGKGSDEQQLLELYDGHGFRSLRVGDKGRGFSRAAVNIYGTIQPAVLERLLKDGDASGIWARFCFAALPDMTRKLPTKSDPEKLRALQAAKQFLKDLMSRLYELPAMNYQLDQEATECFSDYELKKQEDSIATKVMAQAALCGKSAGKVLRFAGILHVLENIINNTLGRAQISLVTLTHAIEIVDALDSWTMRFHARIAGISTDSITSFDRRLHQIALKAKSWVTWTEIRNQMSSAEKSGKTARDAEVSMNKFVALGFGDVKKGPNGGLMYKALKQLPVVEG